MARKLIQFWSSNSNVDHQLVMDFRAYVIDKTQLNGSFYKNYSQIELPTIEQNLQKTDYMIKEQAVLES